MVFVWQSDTVARFWMRDTLIPLSIAWISADGTLLQTDDMQANTDTLHWLQRPPYHYRYAIEVNLGYYARHNIAVGDHVELDLTPSP